jgi:hypothetical protein
MVESTVVVRWFDNGQEASAKKIDRAAFVFALAGVALTMLLVFRK